MHKPKQHKTSSYKPATTKASRKKLPRSNYSDMVYFGSWEKYAPNKEQTESYQDRKRTKK